MATENPTDQIRELDEQLVRLLEQRFALTARTPPGAADASPDCAPDAEARILNELCACEHKHLPDHVLRSVFREVLSGSASLREPVAVGFLGPVATFTHQAALAKFGSSTLYVPQNTIAETFEAVTRGQVRYGVVPVENSTGGAVTHTLDVFTDTSVKICGEANMLIHHCFLSRCERSELKVVYSHPQVFPQCRRWLHGNLPGVQLVEVSSTTEAALRASREENAGALAGELAAEEYGLPIKEANIEDCTENTTRFLVIGTHESEPTGDDKTSVLFVVRDRVGALYESLGPFYHHGVNLTFIESRPSRRRNWEYCFFVDFLGHASEPAARKVLEELQEHCQFIKILGSYPRAPAAGAE